MLLLLEGNKANINVLHYTKTFITSSFTQKAYIDFHKCTQVYTCCCLRTIKLNNLQVFAWILRNKQSQMSRVDPPITLWCLSQWLFWQSFENFFSSENVPLTEVRSVIYKLMRVINWGKLIIWGKFSLWFLNLHTSSL